MAQTQQPTIGTVERAVDVLGAFTEAEGPTLGVTELARQLGLSKAVVHRILTSLRAKGFVTVDQETRRYSLGPAALALGLAYLRHIDVRDQARVVLRELSEETNETATLSIRRGDARIYVDQVTPPREVMMTVQLGHPYPLHAGASSKAFLAQLPEAELARYFSRRLEPLTEITVTDADALRGELADIREKGWAISYGERQEGAGSIAAPVFDHEGRPAAVISVCGPVERFRKEVDGIAPLLVEATRKLSRQLGWEG
jgi:DNA-binding IclR family transcriptional regulator